HRQPTSDAPAASAASEGGLRGVTEASAGAQHRQQPQSQPQSQRQSQPQSGGWSAASGAHGTGPAPLPVRGAREERANPAEAVPGIRPDERRVVAENTATPPTPRTGTVRGTMGKPQLPRRRAQEHIVPQLRSAPVPRQETDQLAGHDPGLMAAFQRGIGLAETQQHMESAHGEAAHMEAAHMESAPMNAGQVEVGHVETGRMDAGLMDAGHTDGGHTDAEHMGDGHMDAGHLGASHMGTSHTLSGHMGSGHTAFDHTGPDHMSASHMDSAHVDPAHMDSAHMDSAHTTSTQGTTSAYTPSPHQPADRTATDPEDSTRLEFMRPASFHLESTSLDAGRVQPTQPARLRPTSLDALHTDVSSMNSRPSMDASPMDPSHFTQTHPGPTPGSDPTPWHDGSAPAG
ncbi:hypothetical protein ABZZ80_35695, partial [Streptomyces sp. NPDC006356]